MATDTIQLAKNEFKLVPAGGEVALTIIKVDAKPKANPTVIEVTYKHESGATLKNKYDLKIEGGLIAFSILARCVLGNDVDEFSIKNDIPKFINKTILCEVVHTESNGNTYANIKKTKQVIKLESTSNEDDEDEDEEDDL